MHILRVRGHYIGQVRGIGCRNWRTVTGKCRSAQGALSRTLAQMGRNDKRARALLMPNLEMAGYYEPVVMMEARRM